MFINEKLCLIFIIKVISRRFAFDIFQNIIDHTSRNQKRRSFSCVCQKLFRNDLSYPCYLFVLKANWNVKFNIHHNPKTIFDFLCFQLNLNNFIQWALRVCSLKVYLERIQFFFYFKRLCILFLLKNGTIN